MSQVLTRRDAIDVIRHVLDEVPNHQRPAYAQGPVHDFVPHDWAVEAVKDAFGLGLKQGQLVFSSVPIANDALLMELNKQRGDLSLETFVSTLLSLHLSVKNAGGHATESSIKGREAAARQQGFEEGLQEGRLLGAQYAEVGHLVHRLYDAAAPGFHTAESSGFTDDFRQVARFSTLEEMHRHYEAWLALMLFLRDAKAEGERREH